MPTTLNVDNLQTGPTTNPDGQTLNLRGTNEAALVVQEVNGKYAELVRRGYVFTARGTAATALPNISTLTNAPTLFNPSNSGRLVYPLYLNINIAAGYATSTSVNLWGLVLGFIPGAGLTPASGQPLATAGTLFTPGLNLVGSAIQPTAQYYTTMTYTSPYAATFPYNQIMDMGVQNFQQIPTLGSVTGVFTNLQYDMQGSAALKPGTAMVLAANTNTGGTGSMTFNVSIVYAEIPIGSAVLP